MASYFRSAMLGGASGAAVVTPPAFTLAKNPGSTPPRSPAPSSLFGRVSRAPSPSQPPPEQQAQQQAQQQASSTPAAGGGGEGEAEEASREARKSGGGDGGGGTPPAAAVAPRSLAAQLQDAQMTPLSTPTPSVVDASEAAEAAADAAAAEAAEAAPAGTRRSLQQRHAPLPRRADADADADVDAPQQQRRDCAAGALALFAPVQARGRGHSCIHSEIPLRATGAARAAPAAAAPHALR
jgi:hypothetical protein